MSTDKIVLFIVVLGALGCLVGLLTGGPSFDLRGRERAPYTVRAICAVGLVILVGIGLWWFASHPLPSL